MDVMTFNPARIRSARRHLRTSDPIMRSMIDEVGSFTLRTEPNRFGMLVRSIISQQISVGAARSIRRKFEEYVEPDGVNPESLMRFDVDELRSVGLSRQKATYLLDLADKVNKGTVQLRTIGRRTDESVIDELTLVKGIGRWTAQMFLIFSLGRLDVFPHDDLGVRIAIRDNYNLDDLPNKKASLEIAAPWRPYASVAAWYCWRSLDLARNKKPSN